MAIYIQVTRGCYSIGNIFLQLFMNAKRDNYITKYTILTLLCSYLPNKVSFTTTVIAVQIYLKFTTIYYLFILLINPICFSSYTLSYTFDFTPKSLSSLSPHLVHIWTRPVDAAGAHVVPVQCSC